MKIGKLRPYKKKHNLKIRAQIFSRFANRKYHILLFFFLSKGENIFYFFWTNKGENILESAYLKSANFFFLRERR